ncbi:putative uncharacterized protein ADARB2-AS1 [Pan paniscus]|uniref:putative uncharacterized protein ADARB2-AS1 n=1 Tax=Pan paniscus TaxID=9597 RepID=UPI0002746374|nr:putative uncharacterized protein ADARB2-AS1 [Pan paniscus]
MKQLFPPPPGTSLTHALGAWRGRERAQAATSLLASSAPQFPTAVEDALMSVLTSHCAPSTPAATRAQQTGTRGHIHPACPCQQSCVGASRPPGRPQIFLPPTTALSLEAYAADTCSAADFLHNPSSGGKVWYLNEASFDLYSYHYFW